MVVQHNMQAANANRMLNVTTSAQSKSTEKLSSGYRINRAADDAAGLTISEKMRKQIKGLDRASTNAEDGVSAVQTAEGALTEVHSMLQRMNELATQASNGTNSESDRSAIQDEISQLTTEIDRVAETTKFNETYLLKGNTDGSSSDVKVNAHDAGLAGKLKDNGDGTTNFSLNKALNVNDKVTIAGKEYTIVDSAKTTDYAAASGTAGKAPNGTADLAAGDKVIKANGTITEITTTNKGTTTLVKGDTFVSGITGEQTKIVSKDYTPTKLDDVATAIRGAGEGNTVTIDGTDYTLSHTSSGTTTLTSDDIIAKLQHGAEVEIAGNTKYTVIGKDDNDDSTITINDAYKMIKNELTTASSIGTDTAATVKNNGDGSFKITNGTVKVKDALSFNLHVGADADMTNKINVDIESMSAAGLGIKGLDVKDATGMKATYAIDAIADAISKVSEQRSSLGAVQNRLEHTISNVDNVVENTTSAESRIRDTDMASEMVNYSKNNILAQAGQSMLAQANQSNQGVLSLLQ